MTQGIKPGDYVDVRAVAVGLDGAGKLIVRVPGAYAVAQMAIADHVVLDVTPREPAAIAADVVCCTYDNIAPLRRG
ncbi:hypothetical protein [Rhodopseudomonas sp. B29]|uniref:hypothetical protein n=1 Tax=Rhodopseudomonas sp. B29 TaxID=95607 RepID=UPI00034B068E|nr:hypothetical protein [Rhodopseudomonas sp. B29]